MGSTLTVRTLAMLVVDAVICARSSSLWHLGMCMKSAVGVEESTGAAARMLDWDGIRGLLTRCGRVGSWPAATAGVWVGWHTRVAWHVVCVLVACPRVKRLGGYVRLGGRGQEAGGRRQEAGGRRRRTCVRGCSRRRSARCNRELLQRALAAGIFDVDPATGFCNRLAMWTIPTSILEAISRTCHAQ